LNNKKTIEKHDQGVRVRRCSHAQRFYDLLHTKAEGADKGNKASKWHYNNF